MTTILLAEDHHIVRQGIRALLERDKNFKVVGETGDGLEATQLAEQLQPDVLVLDLMIPSLNGLEVARQVRQRSPNTCIVILSMHAAEAYVLEALQAGAMAYVLKESHSDELVRAINHALAGRRYLSPPLSERAIEIYIQKAGSGTIDPYDTLTNREREVLHLAAGGTTNAEIAAKLSISPRTVETHRAKLMRKLNLNGHIDLVRYALRRGILPMEE